MATNIDIQGTPISRLPRETSPAGVDVSGVKSGRTVKVSLDLLATKDDVNNIDNNRKGYFYTDTELKAAYPKPKTGWYAYVGSTGTIWKASGNTWVDTGEPIPSDVDLSLYAKKSEVEQLGYEVGAAKSLTRDVNAPFTPAQAATLKAVKDIQIFNGDINIQYAIQVFVADNPTNSWRMWITRVDTNTVYNIPLNHDTTIAWTEYTNASGVIFKILIDWTDISGVILNGAVSENMILSPECFKDKLITEDTFNNEIANVNNSISNLDDNIQSVEKEFNAITDKTIATKWVDSVNGLSTEGYGSSTIVSWGYPVGVRKNISAIQLVAQTYTNTRTRIKIKEVDYNGTELYNQIHDITSSIIIPLTTIIENASGKRLWLEMFCDSRLSIQRTGATAQIYTKADGYPYPRWTTDVNSINTGVLGSGSENYDIKVLIYCDEDQYTIKPDAIPELDYVKDQELDLAVDDIYKTLSAQSNSRPSSNYAETFNIVAKYAYMPGHSAATDIKNDVYSDYFRKNVNKVLVFEQTNSVIRGNFGKNIIQRLKDLEDRGYFIDRFGYIATFYNNSPTKSASVQLRLRSQYTNSSGATVYYTPSSGAKTVNPLSEVSFECVFICQSTWADVLSKGTFDDYSSLQSLGTDEANAFWVEMANTEIRYIDPTGEDVEPIVSPLVIEKGITEEQLDDALIRKINSSSTFTQLLKRNFRISCAGSSVTWGTGFLQDSMLEYLIPLLQKERTDFVGLDGIVVDGISQTLNSTNDRMFFDKKAIKITGVNSTIDFDVTGDEVTIVHAMDRNNNAASLIDLYVDGSLYDTISNFNPTPIGHETKTFVAVAGQKEFPLARPFTYNHIVKVNGIEQTVVLNKGTTMPASGFAVARDIMDTDGKAIVQHTLFSVNALNAGDTVTCEFDYGAELRYEQTTIGKDGAGVLESTYGRGFTPFDPANPGNAAFGSGLDFRQTDERVIKKYTFNEYKSRHIQLKIRSLDPRATGSGTPYFIFNFATNRILYFQNAGIGGWKSSQFNDPTSSNSNILRTWREIIDFQPDIIFYESTPNDDWSVYGYRTYTVYDNLSLAQLQAIRTMPNKRILYNSGTNDYLYERWMGKIAAIDKWGVQLSGDTQIASDPQPGDSVVIGTYYSDGKQCVARIVRSYDPATKTVYFDRPVEDRDHVYSSLQSFVGKEIQIRDLAAYTSPTVELLDKLKGYGNKPIIFLVPNPFPNQLSRDLRAYQPLLDNLADDSERANGYAALQNVYDWQFTQKRDRTITVQASGLISNADGTKSMDLTGITKANNFMNYQVLVNGLDVTNEDAVIYTSYCLGVDRTLYGTALNDNATRGKQVWGNFYPTLVFLKNAPASGDIVINYTTSMWSGDSCHMNENSKKLYAIGYSNLI